MTSVALLVVVTEAGVLEDDTRIGTTSVEVTVTTHTILEALHHQIATAVAAVMKIEVTGVVIVTMTARRIDTVTVVMTVTAEVRHLLATTMTGTPDVGHHRRSTPFLSTVLVSCTDAVITLVLGFTVDNFLQ